MGKAAFALRHKPRGTENRQDACQIPFRIWAIALRLASTAARLAAAALRACSWRTMVRRPGPGVDGFPERFMAQPFFRYLQGTIGVRQKLALPRLLGAGARGVTAGVPVLPKLGERLGNVLPVNGGPRAVGTLAGLVGIGRGSRGKVAGDVTHDAEVERLPLGHLSPPGSGLVRLAHDAIIVHGSDSF